MSTRDTIAAALSSVDGVDGTPAPPDVIVAGAGWPTWISAAPSSYCALVDTWHVFVALPNPNMLATLQAADPLIDAVWAALLDVGEVSLAEAVTVTSGDPSGTGQAVPALRFILTTAGDKP